ncbi:MAG: hypothetical protein JWP81_2059 [Ferruginibacter sp.]|nr:hypothetical protein [Ferruginibacter sp.]
MNIMYFAFFINRKTWGIQQRKAAYDPKNTFTGRPIVKGNVS